MCAINGFNFKDQELILEMNKATKHRGPDGTGIFIDENVSLGHNLLAITDVASKSLQPIVSEDKKYALSYNGEIYNYKSLRTNLETKGEKFSANSDTEVLYKGLVRYGADFLRRLDGMFALAFYDKDRNKLLLARDPAGMKPLYYYWNNGRFIFSSEARGILAHNISRKLDIDAARIFFLFGYVPGHKTLFQFISKVCPSQQIIFDLKKRTIYKKWIDYGNRQKQKIAFNPEKFREMIGNSVLEHTMGLRPFGLYLSGGLDSTVILHELARHGDGRVRTFTTRFDIDDAKINEDADRAKRLSNVYGIEHHELLIREKDFINASEKAIEAMEQPRYNHSVAAYWLLAKYASRDIVVALMGDGGDEQFLGYPKYLSSKFINLRYKRYPAFLLNFLYTFKLIRQKRIPPGPILKFNHPLGRWAGLNTLGRLDYAKALLFWNNFNMSEAIKYLMSTDNPIAVSSLSDMENAIANLDRFFWLADEDFIRNDKIAMCFGMEGRFPFLAREITKYSNSISSEEKIKDGELKSLVRHAYRGHLPDYIINKKKTGWNAPVPQWMHSNFGDMVRETLSKDYYSETRNLFNFDFIRKNYIDSVKEFDFSHLKNFLPVFSFQIWARKFGIKV